MSGDPNVYQEFSYLRQLSKQLIKHNFNAFVNHIGHKKLNNNSMKF